MSDTPETIYLIPDASEGVLGHVWCDDPAPGIGMEPADAIEYRRADVADTALAAAEARIAELEKITEEATSILCGQNFKGNSPLELMARKAMRRMKELEKALERIMRRCEAYIEADAPMQPDSSVMAINDICAATLLNKEPTND